jgi:3-dehydroquinate synthase class II
MLVEAETPDQARHSLLVQNAETVRLVGPAADAGQSSPAGVSAAALGVSSQGVVEDSRDVSSCANWQAVSVSQLKVGDRLYVRRQAGARHTGISINESITER